MFGYLNKSLPWRCRFRIESYMRIVTGRRLLVIDAILTLVTIEKEIESVGARNNIIIGFIQNMTAW